MGLDYIVLLIVAIIGFGGSGWLLWRVKRDKKRCDQKVKHQSNQD